MFTSRQEKYSAKIKIKTISSVVIRDINDNGETNAAKDGSRSPRNKLIVNKNSFYL